MTRSADTPAACADESATLSESGCVTMTAALTVLIWYTSSSVVNSGLAPLGGVFQGVMGRLEEHETYDIAAPSL